MTGRVKIPPRRADNFSGRIVPESERSSLPNAEDPCTAATVDSARRDLILDRLQQNFYDQIPQSERIAAAVLRDLKTLDESSPALLA